MPVSPTCLCLSCPEHGESSIPARRCPAYPSATSHAQWTLVNCPNGNTRFRSDQ